ncbi:hypothetical protein JL721_8853 [Aureococcus anophagefferens]|nr:hypothetical protein JL721_8853 [Aureococcus anophagefferens]
MAKTGKQELGIAVSGAWAATLLDRWASLLGGERENNVARLVVGDVRVTAWDVSKVGRTLLPIELGAGVDYYPSPPPPGVGGETGAFDAGARAMLEGLLKRRFAALPDLLRVCIRASSSRAAGGGGGVAAFYEVCCATRGPARAPTRRRLPGLGDAARYSEFKALAAALKRAARTPPLPGSRRSLESVLSRVGFPDTRASTSAARRSARGSERPRRVGAGATPPAYRGACGGRAGAGARARRALARVGARVRRDGGRRHAGARRPLGELAGEGETGGAFDLAELAPAHRLTVAGHSSASPRRSSAPRRPTAAASTAARRRRGVALGPWLDFAGCGITKMVNVNVAKLEQRFGDAATVDVEVAVADEVAARGGGDSADDLATDERTISAIATRAYQKTLAKHHNWVLRPAAKALLKMTPDRASLLQDRLRGRRVERGRGPTLPTSGALQAASGGSRPSRAYDEEI